MSNEDPWDPARVEHYRRKFAGFQLSPGDEKFLRDVFATGRAEAGMKPLRNRLT